MTDNFFNLKTQLFDELCSSLLKYLGARFAQVFDGEWIHATGQVFVRCVDTRKFFTRAKNQILINSVY